jgi:hypothetical protein
MHELNLTKKSPPRLYNLNGLNGIIIKSGKLVYQYQKDNVIIEVVGY